MPDRLLRAAADEAYEQWRRCDDMRVAGADVDCTALKRVLDAAEAAYRAARYAPERSGTRP